MARHPPVKDITGRIFGRLTVVKRAEIPRQMKWRSMPAFWECVCDCGEKKIVRGAVLRSGATRSCGCLHRENAKKLATRHGHAREPRYHMWSSARGRARRLNLDFDLSIEDVVIPDKCPLLGIPLEIHRGATKKGCYHSNSPSIDRIDPCRGYTKDNCWVVSRRANTIKSDATIEELELIAASLKKKTVSNSRLHKRAKSQLAQSTIPAQGKND